MSGPRQPGQPRSPAAAERLARFESAMRLPLVLASVLPILQWLGHRRSLFGAAIVLASWVIFVVDLVVHMRLLERYVHTWRGRFDVGIVVITGPWSFLPALADSGFLAVVRLARVARLVFVTKHARRLVEQLGRAVVVGVAIVFVCSDIAYHAEKATNTEFKTYADSLWWAVVTICTVGYGDITPRTPTGRWAAVVLMITGIGIIGALAGSLASFLRLTPAPLARGAPSGAAPPLPAPPPSGAMPVGRLPADITADEITTLRSRLRELDDHLERLERRADRPGEPPAGLPVTG
ncbi:MAG: potassium channel family protein [Actinomycetota bacterium]|nr:potassium channel family protein [Actinomycetota bacterium]